MDLALIQRRARARKLLTLQEARTNAASFAEYVLRHELTGERIRNSDMHRDWHAKLDENHHTVLIAPIEHGKSQQITVARPLFDLGNNPNLRICIAQASTALADKSLKTCRQLIESSPELAELFPKLQRSTRPGDPWKDEQITVQRDFIAKEPSLMGTAVGSKNTMGSRFDRIYCDDLLDFVNTLTPAQREKVIKWVHSSLISRLTKTGRIYLVGTPWFEDDVLHHFKGTKGFRCFEYSAVENPDAEPEQWVPTWPDQWPLERLLARRETTLPSEFNRTLLCQVRSDLTSRFKKSWFEACKVLGRRYGMPETRPRTRGGQELRCFTGVDLGPGEHENDAKTVLFTIALLPNGRRWPVEVVGGVWSGPEIIQRLYSTWQRYEPDIYIESNGGQRFLTQFGQAGAMEGSITPFYTGKNKWDPVWGVESLAVEIRHQRWVFPSDEDGNLRSPGLEQFIKECLYFDPKEHTGDYLMAGWMARQALVDFSGERQMNIDTQAR